jgi:hypothetical protein
MNLFNDFIHIVNTMQSFFKIRKSTSIEQRVYLENKLFSCVKAIGTVRLILKFGYVLDLKNVFFIPEFSKNLGLVWVYNFFVFFPTQLKIVNIEKKFHLMYSLNVTYIFCNYKINTIMLFGGLFQMKIILLNQIFKWIFILFFIP